MLSPRWRKVVRDLWGNKLRTILVVLSIAVGIFAVGMIAGARATTVTALDAGWNSTDPASVTLYTDLFDEELLYTVRHMPGVRDADARRQTTVRFQDATYLDATGKRRRRLSARPTTPSGAICPSTPTLTTRRSGSAASGRRAGPGRRPNGRS